MHSAIPRLWPSQWPSEWLLLRQFSTSFHAKQTTNKMKPNLIARRAFAQSSIAIKTLALSLIATVSAAEQSIPKYDGKPADMTKPVQVFILMGQSNMVGAGKFSGGSQRWGKEYLEPVVSVYAGAHDPKADSTRSSLKRHSRWRISAASNRPPIQAAERKSCAASFSRRKPVCLSSILATASPSKTSWL